MTRMKAESKSGRESFESLNVSMSLITHWPRRQIKIESIFTAYRIQSNANNQITLSLSSEALLAALRSASSPASSSYETEEVIMKLAKKNDQAVLSFEISGMTRLGRRVSVSHDVRIEVMRPTDVERLSEPLCPEPDVRPPHFFHVSFTLTSFPPSKTHILLPSLQKLRAVVDRMRPMSDILAVRASNNGRLQLSIRTDSVTVDTQWTDCTNPKTCELNHSTRLRCMRNWTLFYSL